MIIAFKKKKWFIALFGKLYYSGPDAMKIPLDPAAWPIQFHKGLLGASRPGRQYFLDLKSLWCGGESTLATHPIGEVMDVEYNGNSYQMQKSIQYVCRGKREEFMREQYTILPINGKPEIPFMNTCQAEKTPQLTVKHYLFIRNVFSPVPGADFSKFIVIYLF